MNLEDCHFREQRPLNLLFKNRPQNSIVLKILVKLLMVMVSCLL